MMLADPEITEAKFLSKNHKLEVFIVTLRERLVGIVHRHQEHRMIDWPFVIQLGYTPFSLEYIWFNITA